MNKSEYSNPDVYKFLQLLNNNGAPFKSTAEYWLILIDEWKIVVKHAKRISTSSIFSKQNYILHEYSINNDRFTLILTKYYNTIMQQNFMP